MYFLLLGIIGIVLKYLAIGAVATLSWWWVLTPFLAAMAWWAWADAFGYTKKKEIEKMEDRKFKRIAKQHEALGTLRSKRK